MGKNKRIDFVEDLHERADHNINPVYWFNRVTPFTMAQWKADKYFAPLVFVIYTTVEVLWLIALNQHAIQANKSFWKYIFDFSDSFTSARLVGLVLFSVYWVITAIATFQVIVQGIIASAPSSQPERKKEKRRRFQSGPKIGNDFSVKSA